MLFGAVTWVDLDPLNEAELATSCILHLVAPTGSYAGQSSDPENFISVTLVFSSGTNTWHLTMILHGLRFPPEVFTFDTFTIDMAKPFDTGNQYWQLEPWPGFPDFREARFNS